MLRLGWTPAGCVLLIARSALAQASGSVGVGIGTVRFSGGAETSAGIASADFQLSAPSLITTLGGSLAELPGGVRYAAGHGGVWGTSPPLAGDFRLSVGGDWTGTTRSRDGRTAALDGMVEASWGRDRSGVAAGIGPSWGWVSGAGSVTAAHLRARAWWNPDPVRVAVSVEPTRFLGAWFTDLTAGAIFARGAMTTSLAFSARLSAAYGSKGALNAQIGYRLGSSLSAELSGGSYLPDPYQGFPQAGFLAAGIRLAIGPHLPPRPPAVSLLRAGDTTAIVFTVDADSVVAIAGDWNGWQPQPLRRVAPRRWEVRLALARGTYYFNVLVDATTWLVPPGVATVADDFGRTVGVLVVN